MLFFSAYAAAWKKSIGTFSSILEPTEQHFDATNDRVPDGENIEVNHTVIIESSENIESPVMDSNLDIAIDSVVKNNPNSNTLAADNATMRSAHTDVLLRDRLDGQQMYPATKINDVQSSSNPIAQRELASPILILLVNSLGRGGSTFVADILSTFGGKTFYIFEPLVQLQAARIQITEESSSEVLDYTLSCNFIELKKMGPMHRLMRQHIKRGCTDTNCITKLCRNADLRMAKVYIYISHK